MPRPITRAPVDGKCRVCGSTEFGTRNRCRPCNRAIERERRARNPEQRRARDAERSRRWRRANPEKKWAQKLRQFYGLTPKEHASMLRAQGNTCVICKKPDPDCVDHCHETGRVRGILCRPCNVGMGQFRDDLSLLLEAAKYIEEHEHAKA